jgi:transcription antitermination factor NusG
MKQDNQTHWYAVYTAPRAEKKVSERFAEAEIEHYLPLRKVKRRWSDRIKEVEMPVINGYIFVRIQQHDFLKVTKVYGALSFVREGGIPAPIPDIQMEQLKRMVEQAEEPVEFTRESYEHGESITIIKGPLQGLMGELIEMKGHFRVAIRLECFGCALTTVPISFIERAP